MTKPVTLDDIARRVGLSKMTVSLGLRGRGRMSAETRKRIREACRQLGYRPNAAARAMARGRFGSVALLLSTHSGRSVLPDGLLAGIHQGLAERDLHLMLAKLPDEQLTNEGFVPKILREWLADGLLVNYNHAVPEKMIQLLEEYRLPSIWLNAKRDHDAVYPDDRAAGEEITRHLLELGHRRIAYHDLGWNAALRMRGQRHYSQDDRHAGYADAMRSAGLTPRLIEDAEGVTPKNVVRYTLAQLQATDRPTAVVCSSPHQIVEHAAMVAGLRIPEDLSTVTFLSDPWIGDEMRPAAMVVPNEAMGVRSVEMLLGRIRKPSEPVASAALPLQFKSGYSTAPLQGD